MRFKKIIGIKSLYISDNGFLYLEDYVGDKQKVEKHFNRGTPVSYHKGHTYRLPTVVYTYFVGNVPKDKFVTFIKGKSTRLSNLCLEDRNSHMVKDLAGKVFKNGWKVLKELGKNNQIKTVLLECPCKKENSTLKYNHKLETRNIICSCNTFIATRKITKKIAAQIMKDRESGLKVKEICKKWDITSPTFYNVKNNKYNYDKK